MPGQRVLVTTLPPFAGGVPAKTRILCRHLIQHGHSVTVAYYATFSTDPDLLAPSWRVPFGVRPDIRRKKCWEDQDCVAVGSWFPELEAPYYIPSKRWAGLIAAHDRHIAVGGNVLSAYPLVKAGIPHLIWCASGFWADREDRHKRMPLPMRLMDICIKRPWLEELESQVLKADGRKMCVSGYTQDSLIKLGAAPSLTQRLPIPTDPNKFLPPPQPASAGIVGFAGRINDPRKNIGLLIDAVALAVQQGCDIRLQFAGDQVGEKLQACIQRNNLQDRITCLGEMTNDNLPSFYQGLDMFVIPSHQEGLCIAGIEALATGVPVIATRCGGPEDYVVENKTGYLTDRSAKSLADYIVAIASDRVLRGRLSTNARDMAVKNYSFAAFSAGLAQAWHATWGDEP